MPPASYAAWALVFGLAAYTLYLDLGMQATIQALVARNEGAQDAAAVARVGASALKIIGVVILVCLAGACVVAMGLPELFPEIPSSLLSQSQLGLLVIVFGQASSLVGLVLSSHFAGQLRSMVATVVIAPSRLASLLGGVLSAIFTDHIVIIAVFYSVPLLSGSLLLLWRYLGDTRRGRSNPPGNLEETSVHYLLRYSGPLILWNVCMLVVSGVGILIVGRVDYAQLPAYVIAAALVTGLTSVSSAVVQPLLPEMTRAAAEDDSGFALASLVRISSQFNGVLLAIISVLVLICAPIALDLILGDAGGHDSVLVLALLIVGNGLRLLTLPLSLAFIATGSHTRILLPPVIEAGMNVTGSIVFGMLFGAPGVALGYFVGSLTCLCLTMTWSMRISRRIVLKSSTLMFVSLVNPLIVVSPTFAAIVGVHLLGISNPGSALAICLSSLGVTLPLIWLFGVPIEWRLRIRRRLVLRRTK
jgi:O-antigen/teichoic acid export membrane protein